MDQLAINILNAKLHELLDLRRELTSCTPPLAAYLEVLISYLKNDKPDLSLAYQKLLTTLAPMNNLRPSCQNSAPTLTHELERDTNGQWWFLAPIALARLRIRFNEDLTETLNELSAVSARSDLPPLWQGEAAFVQALVFGLQKNYDSEFKSYIEAYRWLEKSGATAKALLSLQNSLASQQSLEPKKKFIVEYSQLLEKALSKRCFSTAGLSALNLSRQYQSLHSPNMALKLANLSLKCLKKDLGTQHYGLALCHRAHLLFELGRETEAQLDLEEAMAFDFAEVKNAISWTKALTQQSVFLPEGPESPAWKERGAPTKSVNSANCLGIAEEKLVRALAKRPLNRNELLQIIFSDEWNRLDYEVLLNRLKNLISRVRKKVPDLILFDGQRYRLSAIAKDVGLQLRGVNS